MTNLLVHTRRPDITFCHNGRILITAKVVKALRLRPGDAINIALDNGEYLLFATHVDNAGTGRLHAQCYPTKHGSHNYCANSTQLCRALLRSVGSIAKRVSYMVGKEITLNGNIYLPIITRRPL